jgi:hypothetical protein
MAKTRALKDAAMDPMAIKQPTAAPVKDPETRKMGPLKILLAFTVGVVVGVIARRLLRVI